jgi:hypothetical protein
MTSEVNQLDHDKANLEISSLPPLEVPCDECESAGGYQDYSGWVNCHACGGAGYVATKAGEQVLVLLEHQAKRRDLKPSDAD